MRSLHGCAMAARPWIPALLLASCLLCCNAVDLMGSANLQRQLRGPRNSIDLSKVTQLSDSPKVYLYEDFLSQQECEYLILNAMRKLDPPGGVGLGTATFLRKYQDALIRGVEDRISEWLLLPRSSPEAIKPLRYNEGQTFDVHYEFFSNPSADKRKGGRAATVVLFLSDVESGGEIVFPGAELDEATEKAQKRGTGVCTAKGLVVKPKRGSAIFFINLTPDGKRHPNAEFLECPVERGQKWMAAKWLAVQKYSVRRDPNACVDEHESCPLWAEQGECEKNPKYMVGSSGFIGNCRKACGACKPKPPST